MIENLNGGIVARAWARWEVCSKESKVRAEDMSSRRVRVGVIHIGSVRLSISRRECECECECGWGMRVRGYKLQVSRESVLEDGVSSLKE